MEKSPGKQETNCSLKKWQSRQENKQCFSVLKSGKIASKQTSIAVIKMAKSPGKQAMNCSLKKWQNHQVKKQRFAVLKSGKIAR
jgi:hypothetical protein